MESDDFWERSAKADPLWAILSDPTKKGRRWNIDSFFETGRREISLLLYQLKQLDSLPHHGKALDFGCGVGRLTQALANHFGEVTGIDISHTMLHLARRLNRCGDKVRYVHNRTADLSAFRSASFDFVYSDIVLQHIVPEDTISYIKEFVRVLGPAGIAVFQLPSHRREKVDRISPRPMLDHMYRVRIDMMTPVVELAAGANATLLVSATNLSDQTWSRNEFGTIRVGNHWLDAHTSEMLIQDDGRADLPETLAPLQAHAVVLNVHAPAEPGSYVCEVDAVHEGVTWFADKGCAPIRLPIRVFDPDAGDRSVVTASVPGATHFGLADVGAWAWPNIYDQIPENIDQPTEFPMFGVKKETVERIIYDAGGRLFHLEQDERCGKEWVGFKFFVRK